MDFNKKIDYVLSLLYEANQDGIPGIFPIHEFERKGLYLGQEELDKMVTILKNKRLIVSQSARPDVRIYFDPSGDGQKFVENESFSRPEKPIVNSNITRTLTLNNMEMHKVAEMLKNTHWATGSGYSTHVEYQFSEGILFINGKQFGLYEIIKKHDSFVIFLPGVEIQIINLNPYVIILNSGQGDFVMGKYDQKLK